jgi:CYTH domain-containing protein
MERAELEIEISDQQFQALWKLVEGRHVTKRRFYLPLGTLTAEVDIYGGELDGLITAEVEFESMDAGEGFEPPEWFGAEVTDDDRFANQSLAQAARPPEPAP